MSGEFSNERSLCWRIRPELAQLGLRSLHRKIPFLTRLSETGSMTGWGVGSLVHTVSTIQSVRTAEIVLDLKQAVSAGFSPVLFRSFGLRRRLRSFWPIFSRPSLQREIPFPGARFRRPLLLGSPGILGVFGLKTPSQTRSVLLRIKSEGFELAAPFSGSIAKSLDPNATRQTTFDGRPDEIRC